MTPHNQIGLELHPTTIRAVLADCSSPSYLTVLASAEIPTAGIIGDTIVDASALSAQIKLLLSEIEEKSKQTAYGIIISVAGEHLSTSNHSAEISIAEVTEQNIMQVEDLACEIDLPEGDAFLHSMIKYYALDGVKSSSPPKVWSKGTTLSAESHLIYGNKKRIQSYMNVVLEATKGTGNGLSDIVYTPVAEEMELGEIHPTLTQYEIPLGLLYYYHRAEHETPPAIQYAFGSRPPARIGTMLGCIEDYWRRNPDLRFHQLISNLQSAYSHAHDGRGRTDYMDADGLQRAHIDLYNVEDTEFQSFLNQDLN